MKSKYLERVNELVPLNIYYTNEEIQVKMCELAEEVEKFFVVEKFLPYVEELLQRQRELSIKRLFELGRTFCIIKSNHGVQKELENEKLKIE